MLAEGRFWSEALYFMHLVVEKAIKAHVVKATKETPPYIHNLIRLAELAGLPLSQNQLKLCVTLNEYQRTARYADVCLQEPSDEDGTRLLSDAKELQEWLLSTL